MSDVQFQEDQFSSNLSRFNQPEARGIIGFLIKRGIVRDERHANVVLIGVIIIAVTVTYFTSFGGSSSPKVPPTYREDISPEVLKTLPPEILKTIPSKNDKK